MNKGEGMFKTTCACGCGKQVYAYAKDKLGTLPAVYFDKTCEAKVKYEKRFK